VRPGPFRGLPHRSGMSGVLRRAGGPRPPAGGAAARNRVLRIEFACVAPAPAVRPRWYVCCNLETR